MSAREPKKSISQALLRLPQTYRLQYLIEGNRRLAIVRVTGTMEVNDLIQQIYQEGKGSFFRDISSAALALFKVCQGLHVIMDI
jgi:hypothetical protein